MRTNPEFDADRQTQLFTKQRLGASHLARPCPSAFCSACPRSAPMHRTSVRPRSAAIRRSRPFTLTSTPPFLVVHFDQGWHYKMQPYRAMLARRGLKQSMSRKGNCFDNAANDGSFGPLVRVVSPGGGAMQAFWPLRRAAVTVAARSQHADRGRASACHSHGSAQPFASGFKTRPTSPMRGLGFWHHERRCAVVRALNALSTFRLVRGPLRCGDRWRRSKVRPAPTPRLPRSPPSLLQRTAPGFGSAAPD